MPRRILRGTVISTKAAKTIVVNVETTKKHPLYGKTMRGNKKFHAHDAEEACNVGDLVDIIECTPKSRLKRFELASRIKVAGELVTDTASEQADAVLAKPEKEDKPVVADASAEETPEAPAAAAAADEAKEQPST